MKKEYFMPTLEIGYYNDVIILSGNGDETGNDIWGEGGLDLS